jgi:hypothetical protein
MIDFAAPSAQLSLNALLQIAASASASHCDTSLLNRTSFEWPSMFTVRLFISPFVEQSRRSMADKITDVLNRKPEKDVRRSQINLSVIGKVLHRRARYEPGLAGCFSGHRIQSSVRHRLNAGRQRWRDDRPVLD